MLSSQEASEFSKKPKSKKTSKHVSMSNTSLNETTNQTIEEIKEKKEEISSKPKKEKKSKSHQKTTLPDEPINQAKENIEKMLEKKEYATKLKKEKTKIDKLKKTMKKHKKMEFYLNIVVKHLTNEAVILRSQFPSLILYRNKYFPKWKLLESVCVEYLKDKTQLVIKDIDWEPNQDKDKNNDSDNEKDEKPPSPYLVFLVDEKDHEEDENSEFVIPLKFDLPERGDDDILKHRFEKRLQKLFEHVPFTPFPYQLEFYDHWFTHIGLKLFSSVLNLHEAYLLYWKMGAGKSQSSLLPWSKNYVKRVYILCVNTMIEPWMKFVVSMPQPIKTTTRFIILGLTEFGNLVKDNGHFLQDEIVIFDEAHMFRNLTPSMHIEINALIKAKILLNLTGTPIINSPNNLIGLGKIMMYTFSNDDITLLSSHEVTQDIQSKMILLIRKIFTNKVHFCDPSVEKEKYAPLKIEIKEVEMSWKQTLDYLVHERQKFQIGNIEISSSRRNSYHNAQKRLSNSDITGGESPKFAMIISDTVNMLRNMGEMGPKQQIIYSNFLGNGIIPIYKTIKRENFRISLATGDSSNRERSDSFNKYNTKESNVLTMSSIGGIGLTFRNTDVLRLVDSFENIAMENQCIHRISRIGAHDVKKGDPLPTVLVIKYISTFPTIFSPEESINVCDYFYKHYCNASWGKKEELFGCPDKEFIKLLIEKIIHEENSETIDQKLLKSNVTKEVVLIPLSKEIAIIGTHLKK